MLKSSVLAGVVASLLLAAFPLSAEELSPLNLYEDLRAFALAPQSVSVDGWVLKRDRLEMRFTGQFYFAERVAGQVCGAVFLGRGELRAEPSSVYERENLKRLLKSEVVEATFTTAVLRFTDDTYDLLAATSPPLDSSPSTQAQKLAAEMEDRLVRETGLNLSARLALAILVRDDPGVFFGLFDGGKPGRFGALLDHQARSLVDAFEVDGGEKGLLFQYNSLLLGNDVWTAFYDEADMARGHAAYTDVFNLFEVPDCRMTIDLRDPRERILLEAELDMVARGDGLRWIPMRINEGLGEYEDRRLKKAVRVQSASLADGTPLEVVQREWEAGFSLLLPSPLRAQEKATVKLKLEGKALWRWTGDFFYLETTTSWYPRHGYLTRSRYDLTFLHPRKLRVASMGERTQEGPAEDNPDEALTRWKTEEPVAFVTFALGPFKSYLETAELPDRPLPLEFFSVGKEQIVKEDFLLAEMSNSVRFFDHLFGDYPYPRLGAVYFPRPFGQGFATLLLLPAQGFAGRREFAFIAHEAAHQWWGNVVGWRSYRDQWLSEGFAQYSGVLYVGKREKSRKKEMSLIDDMRDRLGKPPITELGKWGEGKLYEVGPLVLGHRLSTRETLDAYFALIYYKGALVLRMLEFLLSDPNTLDEAPFLNMMRDFVSRHRNGWASTEDFFAVASEHFARSPLGQRFGIRDLNWFLEQWVYQTAIPSYRLEYRFQPEAGGRTLLTGTLYQEGVPEDWFMLVPVVLEFPGGGLARAALPAQGRATPVQLRLPAQPQSVKLDPGKWVLSLKTSEKGP